MNEGSGKTRCVVRVSTSYWSDSRSIHVKKSISYLKRTSQGHNWLDEEVDMIGADEVIRSIVNFDSCKDGLYTVEFCNLSTDWETGHIDGYDLFLKPYIPTK